MHGLEVILGSLNLSLQLRVLSLRFGELALHGSFVLLSSFGLLLQPLLELLSFFKFLGSVEELALIYITFLNQTMGCDVGLMEMARNYENELSKTMNNK